MFKKVGRDIRIKVLLVEDNIDIADNIYEYLKDEVDMSCAYDGIDAIYKIDTFNFDIIILDLMLPEVSGMEVLKHIRDKQLNLGVLVLTAKEALGDKLKAFNLGANDYLTEKLYELTELLVKNRGMVLFKEQIFDNICGYNSDASTEIIEVYMSRLRKQLNKFGYDKFIVTKRGIGYLLDENIEE
ncbi:MAG: response regulator transcription factor [Clostridium sp.]|nr:response regulator transcription factor [Clostridium sp.]